MLRRRERLLAGLASREAGRPGSPHRSTHWLRLTALGRGRGSCRPRQPPRSTCPPPSTGSTLCCGEKPCPCRLVPYPSPTRRGHGCQRPAPTSGVERGQGACRHWAPGGRVSLPAATGAGPSVATPTYRLFCLWADPAGRPVTSSSRSEGEEGALSLRHQEAGSEVTPH